MRGKLRILLSIFLSIIALGALAIIASNPAQVTRAAAEITVCQTSPTCDYTTIQEAVDAASPGDIIKVAAGTYTDIHTVNYTQQIVYISKTITILGGYLDDFVDPPDPTTNVTLLDADGQGRGVYIDGWTPPQGVGASGIDAPALGTISPTIAGLAITGGDATGLIGVSSYEEDGGGGILISFADGVVRDCDIYSNTASRASFGAWGGGIMVDMGAPVIEGNRIAHNAASASAIVYGQGGGLALYGSTAAVVNNRFVGNVANVAAIAGEGTDGMGGAIFSDGSANLFVDNLIYDNAGSKTGNGLGGGIGVYNFDTSIFINTVLVSNTPGCMAKQQPEDCIGAAIYSDYSGATFLQTTLHDNCDNGDCAAVAVGYDGTLALTNTIVTSETVGLYIGSLGTARVDGILWYSVLTATDGIGAIDIAHAITGDPLFASDGYHLLAGSPAIDAGVPMTLPAALVDIDGNPRPINEAPDLGADEAVPSMVIGPGGGTLVYTSGMGSGVGVAVPPGATVETTTLTLTPLVTPTAPLSPGIYFAGTAFQIDALCLRGTERIYLPLVTRANATAMASARQAPAAVAKIAALDAGGMSICGTGFVPCDLSFHEPVTVTLQYTDAMITGLDEATLTLYYYTGTHWEDVATTCTPPSNYIRDLDLNQLSVAICHLTQFAIGGE